MTTTEQRRLFLTALILGLVVQATATIAGYTTGQFLGITTAGLTMVVVYFAHAFNRKHFMPLSLLPGNIILLCMVIYNATLYGIGYRPTFWGLVSSALATVVILGSLYFAHREIRKGCGDKK